MMKLLLITLTCFPSVLFAQKKPSFRTGVSSRSPEKVERNPVLISQLKEKRDPVMVALFTQTWFDSLGRESNYLAMQAGGINIDAALTRKNNLNITLDFGAAYGYVLATDSATPLLPFNEQAFVDELYLAHSEKNLRLQVGKIRLLPTQQENPLLFSLSNPLMNYQNVLPAFAVTTEFHSSDVERKHSLLVYLGEGVNGRKIPTQSDFSLRSEGPMVGIKARAQVADNFLRNGTKLSLNGSFVTDMSYPLENFVTKTVGARMESANKIFDAWVLGSHFNNSPYVVNPKTEYALQAGFSCRPAPKNRIGVVMTCVQDDQRQGVLYYEYRLNEGLAILGYVGYTSYDKVYDNLGVKDGVIGGVMVDLAAYLNPVYKSLQKAAR